jgi:YMGG-like Gly-zipper
MLNRKPLIVAALGVTLAVGTLSTQAYANDDALLGALVGAGIGAAIGHNVHGRDGAVVGGAIGALAGASIAASSDRYYDGGYQDVPVYYGDTYYQTEPVYYGRPSVVYASPRVSYVGYRWPRYVQHGRQNDNGRNDRHGDNGRRGR